MTGTVDIYLSDLEEQFDPGLVRQVFCDDGSGVPGPRLFTSCSVARAFADAVLLKAWTLEEIETLILEDPAIKSGVLDLVLAQGMKGRLMWDTKDGPRETFFKSGMNTLNLVVDGQLRSRAESRGVTKNPHVSMGRVNTQRTPHEFVFAPSRSRPIRGGF